MSRIFASEDIAQLVTNFSPLSLDHDLPLLLPSSSGDALIDIAKASKKLEKLLKDHQTRIPKSSLPQILGIQQNNLEVLLKRLATTPLESADHQDLIPNPLIDCAFNELRERVQKGCPELRSLAIEKNVDPVQFERVFGIRKPKTWRSVSDSGKTYVCDELTDNEIKSRIGIVIDDVWPEACEISDELPDEYPVPVMQALLNEMIEEGMGGEAHYQEGRLLYIPANHSAAADEKLKQRQLERVQELARLVTENGYCLLDVQSGNADTTESVLVETRRTSSNGGDIKVIEVSRDKQSLLAKTATATIAQLLVLDKILQKELATLRSTVADEAEKLWNNDDRASRLKPFTQKLQRGEPVLQSATELSDLILRSEHSKSLIPSVNERVDKLTREENLKFAQLVEARLLISLQLYSAGIDTVKDATLKQHLDDFVAEHFRNDVIPPLVKAAQDQKLLRDGAREKQFNKLKEASAAGKTFEALQSSVCKFCKKVNIESPSEETVAIGKQRALQATVKSLRQMKRASDVLQNLIWILLARNSNGLFMSSGKDTSRMIRQYQAVGDSEIAEKLTSWRDILKKGEETKDDLEAMRALAVKIAEELQA